MTSSLPDRNLLGEHGEKIALAYLEEQGYLLESKNWRGRRGELDLIMRQDAMLIIVEVRTTSTRWLERPSEATPLKKQRQVALCTDEYLNRRPPDAPSIINIRFDVIGVLIPPQPLTHLPSESAHLPEIDHIEDAYHSPWAY